MKTFLLAVSLALTITALPPAIAEEGHQAQTTTAATHAGRGKIISVDKQAGTVKLTHDPIKSLKWPKMTMDFKAHDAALLKDIKPGDQVDFEIMKMDGGYHIMTISPSNAAKGAEQGAHDHGTHGHGDTAVGQPGDPDKIGRTIKITAQDIKYDQSEILVKAGETVKFVVTNTGKLKHEFIIGSSDEQRQHAEMMKQTPDMVHEDANTLTLGPGETKNLVWRFIKAGALEVACHIPGHYEAGMKSKVTVRR